MKGYITMFDAWDIVDGTRKKPGASDADYGDWRTKDACARGTILTHTSQDVQDNCFTDTMTTAKEMWDVLVKWYDTTNEVTTFALFEELIHKDRLKDNKTLIDQFSALVARLSKVNTEDVKLLDTLKAIILMSKVPEFYWSVMTTLVQTNKLKVLTTDKIREALEMELSFRRATFQGPDAGASKVSQTKPKLKKPCSHCKGTNHDESHCWQKYPEKKPKNMKGKSKKEKGKEKDTGVTLRANSERNSDISPISAPTPISILWSVLFFRSFLTCFSDPRTLSPLFIFSEITDFYMCLPCWSWRIALFQL